MVSRAHTVAFLGVEAKPVEVQCALTPGLTAFNVVGLPDKAVSESRERVRAALTAIGLAMPPQRITVNLSPADLPKAGSHCRVPSRHLRLTTPEQPNHLNNPNRRQSAAERLRQWNIVITETKTTRPRAMSWRGS